MEELQKIDLDQPTPTSPSSVNNPTLEKMSMQSPAKSKITLIVTIVAVVLGIGSGWFVAQKKLLLAGNAPGASVLSQNPDNAGSVKVGDVFGNSDEKTFRDSVEGVLIAGGIDGEGSHHLERGAEKSQWVYLTSSVVDLDNFVGHKIQVWGETFQGKKAGWLMDVGRLKVLELNVQSAQSDSTQEE